MVKYREAESLKLLLSTVNRLAGKRDKKSDGWIGNADHQTRTSDHNPWVKDRAGIGVVRARDFTDDDLGGPGARMDARTLAHSLAGLLGKHPALGPGAYVISEGRIISTNRLREGWRPYSGPNAHEKHCHVSVGLAGYDSRTPWPVKVWPTAKPSRVDGARVQLRAALANTTHPRRRRRISAALEDLEGVA